MKKKASIGAKEIGVIVLISFFLLLFFYAFFGEGSALDKLKAGVFSFGNRSPIKISIGQEPTDKEIEIIRVDGWAGKNTSNANYLLTKMYLINDHRN